MSGRRGARGHTYRPSPAHDTIGARYIGTCPTTGKRSYLERATAKKAVRVMGTGNHLATYRCEDCGHWHVGHRRPEGTRQFYRDLAQWRREQDRTQP